MNLSSLSVEVVSHEHPSYQSISPHMETQKDISPMHRSCPHEMDDSCVCVCVCVRVCVSGMCETLFYPCFFSPWEVSVHNTHTVTKVYTMPCTLCISSIMYFKHNVSCKKVKITQIQ